MKLKKPFPLVTEYMTVGVSGEGLPIFYRDVYGYDKDYFKGHLPATTEVRWGDPQLRPAWVPRHPRRAKLWISPSNFRRRRQVSLKVVFVVAIDVPIKDR